MSDRTERIESQGKTVDEAVSEALLRLGARRDEVTIEVLDEGKSGLLGFLGGRPARVAVTRKAPAGAEPRRGGGQTRGREPRRGPAREHEGGRAPRESAGRQERSAGPRPEGRGREQDEEGGRGRRRGGRGRGRRGEAGAAGREGRPERPERPEPPAPPIATGQAGRPAGGAPRRRPVEAGPAGGDEPEVLGPEVRAVDVAQPTRGVAADDVPAALERITTDIMRLSGFPCRTEVVPGDYHLVKVFTDDNSAGVLIGRHGATIDALEHVVERMIGQAVGDRVNLNLDVNNYRRRRQEALVERARQLVQRVQQTGHEVHMEPLCARERRVVHLEVAEFPGLRTYTLGGPGGKHVVIAPEGTGPEAGERDAGGESDEDEEPLAGSPADEDDGGLAGDDRYAAGDELDDGPDDPADARP